MMVWASPSRNSYFYNTLPGQKSIVVGCNFLNVGIVLLGIAEGCKANLPEFFIVALAVVAKPTILLLCLQIPEQNLNFQILLRSGWEWVEARAPPQPWGGGNGGFLEEAVNALHDVHAFDEQECQELLTYGSA